MGRPKLATCRRGHDTSKPGQRYSNGGCKECKREYARERGRERGQTPEHKEYMREYMREYRQAPGYRESQREYRREHRYGSPEAWVRGALISAKVRAKKKGLEFSLTVEDLLPMPVECPGCKDPHPLWYGGGPRREDTASIDRLDSTRGYVPDNVWITCCRFNRIKNDATPDELYQVFIATQKELNCRQVLTLA